MRCARHMCIDEMIHCEFVTRVGKLGWYVCMCVCVCACVRACVRNHPLLREPREPRELM
ncbi:hypothetical protein Hanom_Chr09g00790361 [Helianthus anomalus]